MNLLAFLLASLPFAAPTLFAAIGEWISERAGIVGIHTEGVMLGAAFAGVYVSAKSGSPALGLLAGSGVAIVLALLFALFTVRFGEDQVVVGTGINLLVLGATSSLFRVAFGDSGALLSVPRLPLATLTIGGLLVVGAALWLARSRFGLALRACGEAPEAVTSAGFSVARIRTLAVLAAAIFAGFGGVYLSLGVVGSFAPGMTEGRGFVAIALVSFGRWKPSRIALGAVLVGLAEALQYRFQGGLIPPQLLLMAPYLLTFLVLIVAGPGRGGAPRALGQAYRK